MHPLKVWMDKKKYTLNTLAEEINVSTVVIRKWLIGDYSPRLLHIIKLEKLSKGKLKKEQLLSEKDKRALDESK